VGKTRLLIANYIESSLISELAKRDYDITTVNTRIGDRLAPHLIKSKFDLVYFAKFYPPIWDDVEFLFRRTEIPVIYAFCSPSIIFNPYRLQNYLLNAISSVKLFYIKIARSVAAFHVLNTSEYHMLNSLSFRCYYIPFGVDTERFKQGLKNNRFTVVFVGSTYGKGVDMLTKILPKVVRMAPDLRVVFAGKGFLSEHLALLKSMYRNNVELYGWRPQDEFAKLLGSSHILLTLSRFETFGLAVLEALSSGMPVVCYDIPGAPKDIVKKYDVGVVAKPFKTEEIVNGILGYHELWKNEPEEFKRLSLACRNVALRYDWSIVARCFDDMFKKTLYKED